MQKKTLNEDRYFVRWWQDGKYMYCRKLSRSGLHALIKRLIRRGVSVKAMEFWKE